MIFQDSEDNHSRMSNSAIPAVSWKGVVIEVQIMDNTSSSLNTAESANSVNVTSAFKERKKIVGLVIIDYEGFFLTQSYIGHAISAREYMHRKFI